MGSEMCIRDSPLVAFLDHSFVTGSAPAAETLIWHTVLFRIWVMRKALTCGQWPRIGRVDVPAELTSRPWFFKQDPISKALSLTRTGAEEIPATLESIAGLECAAVWSANHVEDRLRDHFAGRPNKWVKSSRKLE